MTREQEVLEVMAGEGSVVLEPLVSTVMSPVHVAVENDLWRVSLPSGEQAVLRIIHDEMTAEFDHDAMVAGASRAADAGIGPAVLAQDAAKGALLLEYLGEGWRAATMWDLYDPEVRRKVIAAVRSLHRSASITQEFDPLQRLEEVSRRARQADTSLPDDFDWLRDCAAQIGEAMAAQPADRVLCRNDGSSSNIMLHESGEVRLLDYDQAGMNDPAYDLGVLMAEGAVFDDEALAWLEEVDASERQALLYRAQLFGALDDLLWATRTAFHAHVSIRIHVEFRKYSEWRFMRARRVLADRRFEWMLRGVKGG